MRRLCLLSLAATLVAAGPAKAPAFPRTARFEGAMYVLAARYEIAPALAEEIIWAAQDEHMPVGIAFRLVRRESGFRIDARGRAGEIGLTQIKPATARLFAPHITVAALYVPRVNLRLGFRYAVAITRRHHGDWYRGLTGYHFGPRRVVAASRRPHNLNYASGIFLNGADALGGRPAPEPSSGQ